MILTNGYGGAGIAVEQGSSKNQITNMSAGNGGTADLIDNGTSGDGGL